MSRALLFLLALGGAAFLQILVAHLLPGLGAGFDPFLVVVLWSALGARSSPPALLAGTVGGLVRDALTGGRLGLHGFAFTLAAWGLHGLRQRFVIQAPLQILLLFCVVAAAEQTVLAILEATLVAHPELPEPSAVLGIVLTSGFLGFALHVGSRRLGGWVLEKRESRRRRLGLETRG